MLSNFMRIRLLSAALKSPFSTMGSTIYPQCDKKCDSVSRISAEVIPSHLLRADSHILPFTFMSNGNNIGITTPTGFRIPARIVVPNIERIVPIIYNNPGLPNFNHPIEDPSRIVEIRDNISPSQVEKQAARLIVIRRKKMNKHKLKKLRKRMKYVWAKMKLRREIRKEKTFLNTQMSRIREVQAFDAKLFVDSVLRRAKEVPFPIWWKGEKLPEPLMREELKKVEKRKRQEYLSILDRRQVKKQ